MIDKIFIDSLVSSKSNRINTNKTRLLTELQKVDIIKFSGFSDIDFLTSVYCVFHRVNPKKCKTCGKNLNIENFAIGFPEQKQYCSLKCKNSYDPLMEESGEICTDFNLLLDVNGNPSTAKMNRYLNRPTLDYLQKKFDLQTDDKKTLLYAAIHPDFKIHKCLECSSEIKIHNFQTPYRDNQIYCSIECKDRNSVYQDRLADNKRGISRYENESFYKNVSVPSFNRLKDLVVKKFETEIVSSVDTFIETKTLRLRCQNCSFEFEKNRGLNVSYYCRMCFPNCSSQQIEIAKYVTSLGYKIDLDSNKIIPPKQIDIWIPSKKIGIEYDGFYWHDDKEDKEKWKLIRESSTRVIRIFEDEYRDKKDLVLSRINSILGINQTKIYARKCELREISDSISKTFLNENHLQGYVPASIRYGLFYDNDLVAVMTFGKSRFSKKYDFELLRFATKKWTTVVGGASKLLKRFRTLYTDKTIVSYCDLRYSSGNLYEQLGFRFSHRSEPNYFYYGNKLRYSRIQFQKHKLKDKLELFDETLSETENMSLNGYLKIWDCGNNVYEMLT